MQTTRLCSLGGVLDHHHVLASEAAIAEFGDRGSGIGQQALLVRWIDPGSRDDARTVAWADFMLVGVDQRIKGCPLDQPFFNE